MSNVPKSHNPPLDIVRGIISANVCCPTNRKWARLQPKYTLFSSSFINHESIYKPSTIGPIMSVRVVSRIRPLLPKELDKDTIVRAESSQEGGPVNVVRIPNPKNEAEEFSFTFNGVYDMQTTQEELFTKEGMDLYWPLFKSVIADHEQLHLISNLFFRASILQYLHMELRGRARHIQ